MERAVSLQPGTLLPGPLSKREEYARQCQRLQEEGLYSNTLTSLAHRASHQSGDCHQLSRPPDVIGHHRRNPTPDSDHEHSILQLQAAFLLPMRLCMQEAARLIALGTRRDSC